jgi:hypothetical protein
LLCEPNTLYNKTMESSLRRGGDRRRF